MVIAQIDNMNEDCFKISRPYLTLSEKYAVKKHHARIGSGRFTVLNDSASPKMVIQIYCSFLQFF